MDVAPRFTIIVFKKQTVAKMSIAKFSVGVLG